MDGLVKGLGWAGVAAAAFGLSGCVAPAGRPFVPQAAPAHAPQPGQPPAPVELGAYAWLDRSDALLDAIGASPPDYSFTYDGARLYAWTVGDVLIVEEPHEAGYTLYLYEAGQARPFFVRTPQFAAGFDRTELAVIYTRAGEVHAGAEAWRQNKDAFTLQLRGEAIRAAAQRGQWDLDAVEDWAEVELEIETARVVWTEAFANRGEWRRYRERSDAAASRRALREERERRRELAQRYRQWRAGGFAGAPPQGINWTRRRDRDAAPRRPRDRDAQADGERRRDRDAAPGRPRDRDAQADRERPRDRAQQPPARADAEPRPRRRGADEASRNAGGVPPADRAAPVPGAGIDREAERRQQETVRRLERQEPVLIERRLPAAADQDAPRQVEQVGESSRRQEAEAAARQAAAAAAEREKAEAEAARRRQSEADAALAREVEAEAARRQEAERQQAQAEAARGREAETEAAVQREAEADAARRQEAERQQAETEAARNREAEAEAARRREAEAEAARRQEAEAEERRRQAAEAEAQARRREQDVAEPRRPELLDPEGSR
jgi:hypothetical protein